VEGCGGAWGDRRVKGYARQFEADSKGAAAQNLQGSFAVADGSASKWGRGSAAMHFRRPGHTRGAGSRIRGKGRRAGSGWAKVSAGAGRRDGGGLGCGLRADVGLRRLAVWDAG